MFTHAHVRRSWFLIAQLPLLIHGQVDTDQLVHLDIKGLPIAPITCLQKDRDGALWIGTDNGLCRYDGINMDVYRNIPGDSTSLPGDYVRDLAIDRRGMIWVSCFGGVGAFDPRRGGRASPLSFDRKALLNPSGRYTSIDAGDLFLDHDGGIWLTCARGGLARYAAATGMFHDLQELHDALPADQKTPFTTGVIRDEEGRVWCTDAISVYSLDPTTGRIERHATSITAQDARKGIHLEGLIQDPQDPNTLWLGSRGAGLLHFDRRTGVNENYTIAHDGPVNFTNIVWAILPRTSGHLLVAIDKELRDFDPLTRSFSNAIGTLESGSEEFKSIAYALVQDEDERILVGTFNGIFTLPPRTADHTQWMPPGQLICAATDHTGYWAVHQYADRKLYKLGAQGERMDSVPLPYTDEHRFEPISILQTPDGLVLVGSTSGLFLYAPTARSLYRENFQHVPGLPRVPIGIHAIVEGADGFVWLAFNGQGLLRYWPSDGRAELAIPHPTRPIANARRAYRSITAFGEDHLAVTYESGGIGVVDKRTMENAEMMEYGPQGRELANITAVIPGQNDSLFAVTNNEGIVELLYEEDSLRYVTTYVDEQDRANGFGDAAADALGNIWIATNTGLVLFRASDHSFQHIGPVDGLGMSSVASIIPDRDGCMLAWNSQCVSFNASTFARPAGGNGLYIRSVVVHGIAKETAPQAALALPYDSNSVTITYAPIALLHAQALRYEVMLEGKDAHWVENGYQRAVSYIGLEPGDYNFKVRIAGTRDGGMAAGLAFHIVPAWWQTWWFKVLITLLSGGLVFLVSRYILQLRYHERIAALEREREVSAIRTRIARDIHDDIGSGLTRITMLSREMRSGASAADEKEQIAGSIAKASSELIGQLSEIVWTVDPKNDSAEHFVAHLRDMLGRQFEELSIALRTELTVEQGMEQRDIPPDVKRNVTMIMKETVNNALKHASARSITVAMRIRTNELTVRVEDDGKGFDVSAERTRGNGLGNLRKRSEAIGGTLDVVSNGTGTRYTLRVPLNANNHG